MIRWLTFVVVLFTACEVTNMSHRLKQGEYLVQPTSCELPHGSIQAE